MIDLLRAKLSCTPMGARLYITSSKSSSNPTTNNADGRVVGGDDSTNSSTVMVTATVDTVLEFIISDGTVRFDFVDGIRVRATIEGQPISVVPDRGAPGNPVYVSGITYSDAPAVAVNNPGTIAVTNATTVLIGVNANRRQALFTNEGPNPVGLGPVGVTWANRGITLDVGDSWLEDRAANLAWNAITQSAGMTAAVRILTVNA